MRKIWLKDPETGAIWDLLPTNPFDIVGGCAMLDLKGFGFKQEVKQEQVGIDYYISQITSKNINPSGTMYFNGDEHLRNFQAFFGDSRKQFLLYYAPAGEYEPYDQLSSPYYKPVTISSIEKGEKATDGFYECEVVFISQSDVWKRDVYLKIDGLRKMRGEPLVYPYTYTYVLGGRDIYEIDIPNGGREVGCAIRIKNNTDIPISQIEWFIDHTYIDEYGVKQVETQRAKWYTQTTGIMLQKDYELYVDSNATTQEAKVNYPNDTSQSIVEWQEPSWDYINFVQIKHGANRIVFYIDGENVDISVMYQEQKELI